MNDILQGLEILDNTIANSLKHADYERVTGLAKEYFDIFTGSGVKEYLRNYRKSETEESFSQMLDIYETTIPSVVNNLDTMFEKPLRSNRIFSSIDHKNNAARDEILDRMKAFWQGETETGLDAYLRERWKHLVIYDPNAFIVIEFKDFDPVKGKTQPFALEYSSKEAINYAYVSGILDWLICEKPIRYKVVEGDVEGWKDGSKFILYLDNLAVTYTEVDVKQRLTDIPDPQFVEIRKDPKQAVPDRVFVMEVFDTKSEHVPAFRVGYIQDPESGSLPRTTLSTIHHALPFFKKELKSGAELDLTIRGHVFPQKFAYGPRCDGDRENAVPCNGGKTPNGENCSICGGSGVMPIHTTATDVILFPMPNPKKEENAMDLNKAMAYFSPPMELVKFMEEYNERLTEKAKAAIFASQAVTPTKRNYNGQSQPVTATEQDYSWDNVYDTYRPFTAKYSYAWLFITGMIAIYTDNQEGFSSYHAFPRDYKLKPIGTLTAEKKGAVDASLPQHVLQALDNDIADIVYADDQDTLTKIRIKNKFHPFSGKTQAEMVSILNSEEILPYYKILYIYFDTIFDGIDYEIGDAFYLMPYEKQKAEVEKRVNEILKQVEAQKAKDFKEAQKQLAFDRQNQN